MNATEVQTVQPPELTAHDRCDRCGSQAYMRVTLLNGDLLFCGHHATKHNNKLVESALTIQDERSKLVS